jgi:hypothetical protein
MTIRQGSASRARVASRGVPWISRSVPAAKLANNRQAKKKLIATHAKLEISPTHSKRSTSLFLIATKNPLREFPPSLHWTASGSLHLCISLRPLYPESQRRARLGGERFGPGFPRGSEAASFASRMGLRDEGLPHGSCSLTLLRRHPARRRSRTGIKYWEAVAWRLRK